VKREVIVAPRLDHARPRLAPPKRRRQHASLRATARRTTTDHAPPSNEARDRTPLRDRGVVLLAVFTAAMLVMVALAVVVGMHDTFWILVPVMAVDFVLTASVLVMVVRLLDDGDDG
jgi:hypothetical protein